MVVGAGRNHHIEGDNELPCGCDRGRLDGFPCCLEPFPKLYDLLRSARRLQGRKKEDRPDDRPASADRSVVRTSSAVTRDGSEAGKCSNAPPVDLPKLRQLGNEGGSNDGSNAWRGPQPPINASQLGVGDDELAHPRLDLRDPTIEQCDDAPNVCLGHWVCSLL